MTLDKLYELVIYKLVYDYIRYIDLGQPTSKYSCYGKYSKYYFPLYLERWSDSYVLRTTRINTVITKYESFIEH